MNICSDGKIGVKRNKNSKEQSEKKNDYFTIKWR